MLDKEQARTKLKELVEQFSSANKNKDYINGQNEEWVKNLFIEPLLLEVLGWKRQDMEREKRVLKGRADYMLKVGNEEVLVIEAKKVGVTLSEDEGRQGVSYAYHRKVKFAVVTNFKEIRVYHALSNLKNIDQNLIKFETGGYFRFNFEQLVDNFDKLMLLSKESFENKAITKLLPSKIEKASKPIDESILADLLYIREMLSKDLKKVRTSLEKEKIDEIVQILIDRLIFMRSVEDRGLEDKDFLRKMVMDYQEMRSEKRLWTALKEKFRIFDKDYNSKLFAEGLLEQEGAFDDETLAKVVKTLYFGITGTQARYMFDEIPGDLLGSIYEQYLGTILQDTEKRVTLKTESGKRKKMGIYYTPSYIVDYIVKNTVGEYIKGKTIDEILDVNIVDPACGSGSFLIRAFQEICNAVEDRLKKGEKGKMSTFQSYKERLSFSQKAAILSNCIYGVDLDEKAVELAQLNLLLKMLEDEDQTLVNKKLPNLLSNIKNGNSLIDDISVAGDKAFKWEAQFPDIFKGGGFDVVVGNPPYVKIRNEDPLNKISILKEIKDGQINLAAVFINLALKLVKDNQFIGLIVPKQLTYTPAWNKIRDKILNENRILSIIDCKKAFKDVLLEQVIIVLQKASSDKKHNYLAGEIISKEIKVVNKINQLNNLQTGLILLESNPLLMGIKEKVEVNSVSLGKLAYISMGRLSVSTKDRTLFKTEYQKDCRKILRGDDVQRYKIRGALYYSPNNKLFNNLQEEIKRLSRKHIVLQRIVAHVRDHIVPMASLDEEGCFSFITVTNILLNEPEKLNEKYIIGLLNSQLFSYYIYKFIFNNAIRSMDFTKEVTSKIPIRNISLNGQQKITALVDQMLSLQKKFHESKLSGNEKERLEQQIKGIDYEIDEEVYKLYGITKEEQKIIEESLK